MSNFGPSIKAGKLYERTSAKGNVYLTGYFGSFRITILKDTRETGKNGEPVWTLMFGEAPPRDDSKGLGAAKADARAPSRGQAPWPDDHDSF